MQGDEERHAKLQAEVEQLFLFALPFLFISLFELQQLFICPESFYSHLFTFEVEQLTWKLRKMEESRRVYEDATSQLGSFLELVSSQLTVSGRWGSTHFFQLYCISIPFLGI